MNTSLELSEEQERRVREVLASVFLENQDVEIAEGGSLDSSNDVRVRVKPHEYPENMFGFMHSLAEAEIKLRDAGIRVRLTPDIRQRMVVVGTPAGRGEIAYLTTDGREYQDLAQSLGVAEESLLPMMIDGYAYDSEEDLKEAIQEARSEHPSADFSRLAHHIA